MPCESAGPDAADQDPTLTVWFPGTEILTPEPQHTVESGPLTSTGYTSCLKLALTA